MNRIDLHAAQKSPLSTFDGGGGRNGSSKGKKNARGKIERARQKLRVDKVGEEVICLPGRRLTVTIKFLLPSPS